MPTALPRRLSGEASDLCRIHLSTLVPTGQMLPSRPRGWEEVFRWRAARRRCFLTRSSALPATHLKPRGNGVCGCHEAFHGTSDQGAALQVVRCLLSSTTPAARVLQTPPLGPIWLGSDFTGYGTDSLACHYLGLNYEVPFVAEKSAEKDLAGGLGGACHLQSAPGEVR